jgi:hypothetical protein
MKNKKKERKYVRFLKDELAPNLGMRGYVHSPICRSVWDDNSSTLFYVLRQEKYSVVCGSSEREFLH